MGKASQSKKFRARSDTVLIYGMAAVEVFPKYFTKNCCLNGTRVTLDVLRRFEISARPLAVDALAMNSIWYDYFIETGKLPTKELNQKQQPEGAWAVEIDQEGEGGYAGHLVVLAGSWLIDSSVAQFERKEKDIIFSAPILLANLAKMKINEKDFIEGKPLIIYNSHDSVMRYQVIPGKYDYEIMPGFQRTDINKQVAKEVEEAMFRVRPYVKEKEKEKEKVQQKIIDLIQIEYYDLDCGSEIDALLWARERKALFKDPILFIVSYKKVNHIVKKLFSDENLLFMIKPSGWDKLSSTEKTDILNKKVLTVMKTLV